MTVFLGLLGFDSLVGVWDLGFGVFAVLHPLDIIARQLILGLNDER
jgi:hypothetical protein